MEENKRGAMGQFALALHGGAGVDPRRDYSREIVHMRGVVEAARDRLAKPGPGRHR